MRSCLTLLFLCGVFVGGSALAQEVLEKPATNVPIQEDAEKTQESVEKETAPPPVKEPVQEVKEEKPAPAKVEEKKSSARDAITGQKVEPLKNVFAEPEKKQSLRDKVRAKLKE